MLPKSKCKYLQCLGIPGVDVGRQSDTKNQFRLE